MKEPLPLARIQDAVLEFLRHRTDAALFGAQAVNAYVDEARMTQDVYILSTRAPEFAEELRQRLSDEFHIAVRVRAVAEGKGHRLYQVREPKNRHLADIRQVDELPPNQAVSDVRVPIPEELIAQKVLAYTRRRGQPKGGTDWRDLMVLFLKFPHLKTDSGPVLDRLRVAGADAESLTVWKELILTPLQSGDEPDEGF